MTDRRMHARPGDSLLPLATFEPMFEPLIGKRIGFLQGHGNVGDALIELATVRLFGIFGVSWQPFDPARPVDVEAIVYGGGGNMGSLYPECLQQRRACLATGLPVTVFPQSYSAPEALPYARVYVRERASLTLVPEGILAPELALSLRRRDFGPARRGRGIFLRRDGESRQPKPWYVRDPIRWCRTPEAYLHLASRYRHIVTDRLHFAICGLLAGRRVTLLENGYHKNRSMYETWLVEVGCEFAQNWRGAGR